MSRIEVLAPVGGPQQLLAAVRSGADAVYLGTKGFNARRNAANFDGETLRDAVGYCHARNVRVHVTLNTLVSDDELDAVTDTIEMIAKSGADAVIVQDLAVARLVRVCAPGLALHASTQMTIHNCAGVKALETLGFSRVVLARELTLEEIRQITQATPLEVEIFVHGALCVSMSGACYLSCMLGGRSGNRGVCAQPCRLDFQLNGQPFALSLKDMSYIERMAQLMETGVCSLKIEGRMKRPEYVAAAVTACRRALDGEPVDMASLQAVFSRSGFTDGYLTGKRNRTMFGYRRKEDVQAASSVLKQMTALYREERQSVGVNMRLQLHVGAPSRLAVSDGVRCIVVEGEAGLPAQNRPMDASMARRNLEKTGGTPFRLQEVDLQSDGKAILPVQAVNAMRRDALEKLLDARSVPQEKPFTAPPAETETARRRAMPGDLYLRFERAEQLFSCPQAGRILLPLAQIEAHEELIAALGERLVGEIPALVFPEHESKIHSLLERLAQRGLHTVCAENIGAVTMARALGLTVTGGYGLNILNSAALAQYAALGVSEATVSFELAMRKIEELKSPIPLGAIGYGFLPLMKLRACPARNKEGCGSCKGNAQLIDRTGARFALLCQQRRYSVLLNSVPLYIADKPMGGLDFITLYFTTENAEVCRRIAQQFQRGETPDFARTSGMYYRKLQ